jgi:hypothetical protein
MVNSPMIVNRFAPARRTAGSLCFARILETLTGERTRLDHPPISFGMCAIRPAPTATAPGGFPDDAVFIKE